MTWFVEEGSTERSLLYKLEDMNIVRLTSEIDDRVGEIQFYKKQWILTSKGQKLIDENEYLQALWGKGEKVDVIKFYDEVLKKIQL